MKNRVRHFLITNSVLIGLLIFGTLTGCQFSPPQTTPPPQIDRYISVGVVFDEEFSNGHQGPETIEEFITDIVNNASGSFEEQFGIKFNLVEIKKWQPEGWDSLTLINELRNKIPLDNYDLVIAFTGKASDMCSRGEMPYNNHLGNYVLMGWYYKMGKSLSAFKYPLTTDLIHEMGHIFGAVDVETFSVMNYLAKAVTTKFDDYNREIILKNKYLPFK